MGKKEAKGTEEEPGSIGGGWAGGVGTQSLPHPIPGCYLHSEKVSEASKDGGGTLVVEHVFPQISLMREGVYWKVGVMVGLE